jgi:uncharacterized protein YijF (DUF1287 family)
MTGLFWKAVALSFCASCLTAAAADSPRARATEAQEIDAAPPAMPELPPSSPPTREAKIVARAREEVARHVAYDAAYFRLSFLDEKDTGRAVYPGGDLDPRRGVCTDVVIRALRAAGTDLQELVHADILARRAAYPAISAPDVNIDHRRVGPLLTYLRAHATAVPRDDWKAGDVIVWGFRACPACTPDHIGIVSDRIGPRGVPLALHNIGPVPSEDDVLDAWTVLGHFRSSSE